MLAKIEDLPEFDEVVTRVFLKREEDQSSLCALRNDRNVIFLSSNGDIQTRAIARFVSIAMKHGWDVDKKHHHAEKSLINQLNASSQRDERTGDPEQTTEAEDLFYRICGIAIKNKASDIFIEYRPESETHNLIKMRVNGLVENVLAIPSTLASALVAVTYNSLADEDSKSSDHPSFVRNAILGYALQITIENKTYRLRGVTMPAYKKGSDMVLRLLPEETDNSAPSLEELGYLPDQAEIIDRMSSKTTGVLIFCGIAGSGKSTTIRSLLSTLEARHPGKRIAMIEDPIEYKIKGVNQIPLSDIRTGDEKKAWAEAVKGLVRANVDIMALGEVRDPVTAGEVVDYVLAGHQVLTTLHSSSAIGCVQRLNRLGIDRNIIAGQDFISGFVYQRLLPKLCPDCCIPIEEIDDLDSSLAIRLIMVLNDNDTVNLVGPGCSSCHNGYVGRVVAAETMLLDDAMRQLIRDGKDSEAFNAWRQKAKTDVIGHGTTAFEHAMLLMKQGIVSPIDVENSFGYIDTLVIALEVEAAA